MRRAADEFDQTIVMVTHEPSAASARRPRPLPRRRPDRGPDGRPDARVDPRPHEDDRGGAEDMIVRQAFRNLLASKLRLFLTSLAVVLGVGLRRGRLRPRRHDQQGLRRRLRDRQRRAPPCRCAASRPSPRPTASRCPRRCCPSIRAVDGVRSAEGTVVRHRPDHRQGRQARRHLRPAGARLQLVRRPGASTRCGSPPGTPPRGPDDVVIDKTTADDEGFAIGDTVRIITVDRVRRVPPGRASSPSATRTTWPAPRSPAFTTRDRAAGLRLRRALLDGRRHGGPGLSPTPPWPRGSRPLLPAGYEAITGETAAKEASDQFKQFVDIFRNFLLGFAADRPVRGLASSSSTPSRSPSPSARARSGCCGRSAPREARWCARCCSRPSSSGLVASIIGIIFGIAFAAILAGRLQRGRGVAAADHAAGRAALDHRRPRRGHGRDAARRAHAGAGRPAACRRSPRCTTSEIDGSPRARLVVSIVLTVPRRRARAARPAGVARRPRAALHPASASARCCCSSARRCSPSTSPGPWRGSSARRWRGSAWRGGSARRTRCATRRAPPRRPPPSRSASRSSPA